MAKFEIVVIGVVEVDSIGEAFEIANEAESGFYGCASSTVTELK